VTNLFRKKMSSALGLLVCMTYQGDSYHVVGSKLLEGSDPTSRNRMARVFKIPGSRQQVDLCEYFCLRRIDYRIQQMATYVAEWQPVFMRPAAAQQFGTPQKITCTRPWRILHMPLCHSQLSEVNHMDCNDMHHHHVLAIVCLLRCGQGHVETHTL